MTKKQVTKNCHWVPQSYLRSFAASPDKKKIWRFSKNHGDPELKNICKVAYCRYLYVPKDKYGNRDDSFEKKLSSLESFFGSTTWKSACEEMTDLGEDSFRKMLSLQIAVLFLRTPTQLELTKKLHDEFVKLFSDSDGMPSSVIIKGQEIKLDSASWPAYRDSSEDDIKQMWIEQMNNATYFAKLFMDMRWSIVFSEDPVFITTDNPVVFLHPSLGFKGINNPDTRIIFPISPTKMLCLDHLHDEPKNQYYRLASSPAAYNLLMWRNAIEYMFSHRHTDEVCKEF